MQHAFSDQLQSSSSNVQQQSLTSSTSSLYTNSSSNNNNNNNQQQQQAAAAAAAASFSQTLNSIENFLNANRMNAEHFGAMQNDAIASTSNNNNNNNNASPSSSNFQRNRSTNSFNSSFSTSPGSSQLPNLSIVPQRTFNFNLPREPTAIPNGIFQWSVFIVAFPFRFLFSTIFDLFSLFCKYYYFSSLLFIILFLF